jgi:hypothetical protein
MSFTFYELKNNPFSVVPSRTTEVWADRKKFKKDLEDALRFTLRGSQSQIIACIWGDWGCGKTHAMSYFSNEEVLKRLAKETEIPSEKMLLSIPMIFPTKDAFNSVYLEIVYRNLIPMMKNVLTFLSKQMTPLEREGYLENKLLDLRIDEDLAKVLSGFLDSKRSMVVKRYLSKNTSRKDLSDLGVAKGIETDNEMLMVLSDLLKVFVNTIFSRIFIWIDDCERIEEVPGRDMFEFQHFLRDILDLVPEKLTFITSFTKFPGEEISERLKYLGPAVQQRISRIITVDYFSLDEYLEYVDDLLQYHRKSPRGKVIPKYFPFDKKCLLDVFEMVSKSNAPLHPRTVNRVLSSLLESGLREKIVPIDDKYLTRVKDQIQAVIAS